MRHALRFFAALLLVLVSMGSARATIAQRGTATVSVQTNSGGSFSTITINKPTGVVSGDVMVFSVLTWVSSGSVAVPSLSGWTSVLTDTSSTTTITQLKRHAPPTQPAGSGNRSDRAPP